MRDFLIDALVIEDGKQRTARYYVSAPNAVDAKSTVKLIAEVVRWRHMFVRDADGDYRQMF